MDVANAGDAAMTTLKSTVDRAVCARQPNVKPNRPSGGGCGPGGR